MREFEGDRDVDVLLVGVIEIVLVTVGVLLKEVELVADLESEIVFDGVFDDDNDFDELAERDGDLVTEIVGDVDEVGVFEIVGVAVNEREIEGVREFEGTADVDFDEVPESEIEPTGVLEATGDLEEEGDFDIVCDKELDEAPLGNGEDDFVDDLEGVSGIMFIVADGVDVLEIEEVNEREGVDVGVLLCDGRPDGVSVREKLVELVGVLVRVEVIDIVGELDGKDLQMNGAPKLENPL